MKKIHSPFGMVDFTLMENWFKQGFSMARLCLPEKKVFKNPKIKLFQQVKHEQKLTTAPTQTLHPIFKDKGSEQTKTQPL